MIPFPPHCMNRSVIDALPAYEDNGYFAIPVISGTSTAIVHRGALYDRHRNYRPEWHIDHDFLPGATFVGSYRDGELYLWDIMIEGYTSFLFNTSASERLQKIHDLYPDATEHRLYNIARPGIFTLRPRYDLCQYFKELSLIPGTDGMIVKRSNQPLRYGFSERSNAPGMAFFKKI